MKPIMIDDLVKYRLETSEYFVWNASKQIFVWKIIKPKNKSSILDRIKSAYLVLTQKAIGVQYFEDLSIKDKLDNVLGEFNPNPESVFNKINIDFINRKELLLLLDNSQKHYESINRFDYSKGLEKAKYIVSTFGKKCLG